MPKRDINRSESSAPGTFTSDDSPSLRAEQIAQTRAALLAAGRHLFGQRGFANTSVEDLAREARVTTGALYHHFSTKTELFEAVFVQAHGEMTASSVDLADLPDLAALAPVEVLAAGFEAFLDAVLDPDLQRIIVVDGPAVLGLARFTELDERGAFDVIVTILDAAVAAGKLAIDDPPTMARLFFGLSVRAAMLIANSDHPAETRESVALSFRALLNGLATDSRP